MKNFLMGLGVGAALGVMFAPEAGQQTRKKFKQRATPVGWRLGELYRKVSDLLQAEPDLVAQVLNTASKTKLKRVPGIGDATAKRIIQNRPYESGDEVVESAVLPEEVLEKLKEELVENTKEENAKQEEVA